MALGPDACILEQLQPRCRTIGVQTSLLRVIGELPCEEAALWVRHHSQVTAIGRGKASNAHGGTVGVEGVGLSGIVAGVNIPAEYIKALADQYTADYVSRH